jgi:coenzyme F420-0:L-glutamate ligase/coenzyme F420-1:gamma-L-glutamate ligase
LTLEVIPVEGLGEIRRGDDLATLVVRNTELRSGDVVVVTQKVVSKSEGRLVEVDHEDPAERMRVIEEEAVRVLRRRGELVITETRHGFVCANSGVDLSNVQAGTAALLPVDPDRSARRIRDGILAMKGFEVAVVVSDTFGRPWRRGVVDVAIGCAGIAAVVDLKGTKDTFGRELQATEVCLADEIASAAELVMGKARSVPAAVVRGLPVHWLRKGSVSEEIIRPNSEDLFR